MNTDFGIGSQQIVIFCGLGRIGAFPTIIPMVNQKLALSKVEMPSIVDYYGVAVGKT